MTHDADVLGVLATKLRESRRVVVLTGAGMSAESGIPTFRGAGGLWKGLDPTVLASPAGFARHPEDVWEWYRWRVGIVSAARPNPGHVAIAELERHLDVTVVTQNVDGLHHVAGSSHVVELHGTIRRSRCTDALCRRGDSELPLTGETVPSCACGRPLRPAVVWFGEMLPREALADAIRAAEQCDVALVVGTSGVVEPAASLPGVAASSGALVVEINPEPTPLSGSVHYRMRDPAGVVLPAILAQAFS